MHPILARRGRLGPYLVAWLPLAALLGALVGGSSLAEWLRALAFTLPLAMVYAFVCLAAWYVSRAAPLETTNTARLLGSHAIAAGVSSGLWVFLARAWARTLSRTSLFAADGARFAEHMPLLFAVGLLIFLLAAAVDYLLMAFEASREAERRALELKVLATEAELKALRSQIDPHFLFNSLHSISALTAIDPAGARRMSVLLADFLRDSLRLGGQDRISLRDELSLVERFLAIEKVRFGARLAFVTEVDPQAEACLVPPLLLQPLAENAVVHGIGNLVEGGEIAIVARREGSWLAIAVDNPADPDSRTAGTGVGLQNVRRRLAAAYGKEGWLDVHERDGRYRVELRLPATP